MFVSGFLVPRGRSNPRRAFGKIPPLAQQLAKLRPSPAMPATRRDRAHVPSVCLTRDARRLWHRAMFPSFVPHPHQYTAAGTV